MKRNRKSELKIYCCISGLLLGMWGMIGYGYFNSKIPITICETQIENSGRCFELDNSNQKSVELIPTEVEIIPEFIVNEEPPVFFEISNEEREYIYNMVSGEAGHDNLDDKMAVAQCILNGMRKSNWSAEEVRKQYHYDGWNEELKFSTNENDMKDFDEVVEAVHRVFDYGDFVTEKPILYFYAPKWMKNHYSKFHESLCYAGTFGEQRFFYLEEDLNNENLK